MGVLSIRVSAPRQQELDLSYVTLNGSLVEACSTLCISSTDAYSRISPLVESACPTC